MSDLERRSLARRTVVLVLLLALALPAISGSNEVNLRVDGLRTSFRTYAGTVGDVLRNQGVELAAGDVVLPPPYTEIEDGTTIRILRTIEVGLIIDDQPERRVRGTFRSVGELLDTVGLQDRDRMTIRPGVRASLAGGEVVTVRTPRRVVVRVDGQVFFRRTLIERVDLLLADLGIEVADADLIDVDLGAEITDGLEVTIQRVTSDEFVEEVVLPFETQTVATDELYEGESRTAQQGEDGLRVDTYRLTLTDGVETERVLATQEVVREPVPRIVEQGTRERPYADPNDPDTWWRLAWCESRHDWDYNGKSGYDGGLQFHPGTWSAFKPAGYPEYAWQATIDQQIAVAKRVLARQGWRAWPACAKKLGYY